MKKLYRNDLILLILILCLCVGIPAVMYALHADDAKTAVVSFDGKELYRIDLDKPKVVNVNGVTIEVKDGSARVANSTCPDGLCMGMRKAENVGDSIVCVPNKVSVKISGGVEEDVIIAG